MEAEEAAALLAADPPPLEWVTRGVSRDFYQGRSATVAAVLAFTSSGGERPYPQSGPPAWAFRDGKLRDIAEMFRAKDISYHCVVVHLPTGRRWDSTADILGEGDGPIDPVAGFNGTLRDHENHG